MKDNTGDEGSVKISIDVLYMMYIFNLFAFKCCKRSDGVCFCSLIGATSDNTFSYQITYFENYRTVNVIEQTPCKITSVDCP